MHQIDNAFTSQVMPPMEQSGEPGWFHGGGGGTRPTPVGRDWYNMVQAEFLAILSAGNIAPNKAKLNQLAQAIKTIAGSISDKAFESHLSAADPHHMYVKKDSYQEEMAQAISQAVSQHEQKQDPHPQYLTADEGAEQVSQGVSQHEQKQNPHPQYLTADEGAEQVNQGVSQHEQKQDPHPQYLTADEGAEQVNQGVAQHEKKQDPHPQYVNAAGLEFAANAAALQKIEQHKQESDPHPQYFTQEEVQSAIAEALANQPRLGVDVQVFTESGTYVKPKGAKSISVLLIAGGGAGQRGNTAATGAVTGGWSGAGGSVFMGTFPADIASDNHAVIVGHGGVGSYVNPINNNDEGQPSEIVGLFVAPAGSVYASSTDTLASDTPAMYPGMQPLTSNANGAMQSPYSGDKIKKMVLTGMPAGVPGGSISSSGIAQPSLTYGTTPPGYAGLYIHGASGLMRHDRGIPLWTLSAKLDGENATNYLNGTSGCGGAASTTGDGENGGHGGRFGCGGGGGGAAISPYRGGRGGNGGDGLVIITTYM